MRPMTERASEDLVQSSQGSFFQLTQTKQRQAHRLSYQRQADATPWYAYVRKGLYQEVDPKPLQVPMAFGVPRLYQQIPHGFQTWPESLDDSTFTLEGTVRVEMHHGVLKRVYEDPRHLQAVVHKTQASMHPHIPDFAQVQFERSTYRLVDVNRDGRQDALVLVRVFHPQNPLDTERYYLLLFHDIYMRSPRFIASSPALWGKVHALSLGYMSTGEPVVRLGMFPKNTTYASPEPFEAESQSYDLLLKYQQWVATTVLPSPEQTSRRDISVLSQKELESNLQGLPKIFQRCTLSLQGKPYRFVRGAWVSPSTLPSQKTPYVQLVLDTSQYRLFDLDGDGQRDGLFLVHGIASYTNGQDSVQSYLVALTHVDTPEQQTTLGSVAIRGKVQTFSVDTHYYPFQVAVVSRQWQPMDSPCCPSLPYSTQWGLSLKGFRSR
ncbi:MAG: hypothetical protein ACKO37_01645 [Vampirovibrionales bacterium]